MLKQRQSTQLQILNSGKKEFLKHGFRDASLRTIVKEAGVTTGAFYGYYNNKEELFDDLVHEHAVVIMNMFVSAQDEFSKLDAEDQKNHMGEISSDGLSEIVNYIYDHFDEVKLLVCKSFGTSHENFINEMVKVEIIATDQFVKTLQSINHKTNDLDEQMVHIIVSAFFFGFLEIVVHDMPKERALIYVQSLQEFYTAGWKKILGL